ncbi:MAG: hypothetical protein QXR45_06830 [Candidatus Bathyarchaeia archaeon]
MIEKAPDAADSLKIVALYVHRHNRLGNIGSALAINMKILAFDPYRAERRR